MTALTVAWLGLWGSLALFQHQAVLVALLEADLPGVGTTARRGWRSARFASRVAAASGLVPGTAPIRARA
jgi:hypothetical protein